MPEQLERVVLTALATIPADRFATPGQLAQALSPSVAGMTSSPTIATPAGTAETSASPTTRRRKPVPAWLTFVLGLLVTATMGMFLWQRSRRPAETPGTKMLAVLPFKNMGAAGDQYFADGLTEEITSRLAGVSDLGVVSRTSTDPYKGSTKSIRQIGQELGVGYILEGSVRWEKSPDGSSKVRVTPQLIRVADDRHLWADRYDAELADVFQVQSSIAEQVTSAMNLALDPSEKQAINEQPDGRTPRPTTFTCGASSTPTAGRDERTFTIRFRCSGGRSIWIRTSPKPGPGCLRDAPASTGFSTIEPKPPWRRRKPPRSAHSGCVPIFPSPMWRWVTTTTGASWTTIARCRSWLRRERNSPTMQSCSWPLRRSSGARDAGRARSRTSRRQYS